MIDFKNYISNTQKILNPILYNYISNKNLKIDNNILEAMKYSLMAGGKRIRPALCIGSTKIIGKSIKAIIPLACAIEMIHTYSLIHDDLPSIDDDILRRGRLTSHINFDEATATLAGNSLLTLAFEIIAKSSIVKNFYPHKTALEIINNICIAVGAQGMIGGQIKDINSEGNILNYKNLKKIHLLKTGTLIEISVICAAKISGASKIELNQLKNYAHNLGLAFQITDDILNVVSTSLSLGKNIRTDIYRDKNTYPSILGLKTSKIIAEKLINKALLSLNKFDTKANPLRSIGYYVLKRIT